MQITIAHHRQRLAEFCRLVELTDRLVCGVNNEGKFLAEQDLTYERACLAITQGSEEAAPLGNVLKPSATVVVVANTEIVTYRESSRSGYATHIDN